MAADQLTLQESLAASRRIGGLTLRYALCFYLLIPLAVGLNQGWFQAGLARYLPLKLSILLWCGNWAAYWWACELGTRAIAPIVRPWRLAPTAVLLLGSLLATLMSPLYFGLFGQLFMGYLPANVVIPSEADDLPNILSSFRVFELFASGAGGAHRTLGPPHATGAAQQRARPRWCLVPCAGAPGWISDLTIQPGGCQVISLDAHPASPAPCRTTARCWPVSAPSDSHPGNITTCFRRRAAAAP